MTKARYLKKDGTPTQEFIDKMQMYYDLHRHFMCRELEECYQKPSTEKCKVWDRIVRRYPHSLPTVVSYNMHTYTVALISIDTKTNNDVFIVITPYNKYEIDFKYLHRNKTL